MRVMSRQVQATFLLLGTIVGVGMFGIPFVFVQAGFLTGLIELAVLAGAALVVHLAYAEVVLRTPESHRLPGYVTYYFGEQAGWLSRLSHLFLLSGALLAYLILGGSFLGAVLGWMYAGLPPWVGPLLFYLFGVAVIFRGIRFESLANGFLTFGLVLAIVALAVALFPFASRLAFDFHLERLAIPYGVILFAMSGAAVIPDARSLFQKNELRKFKPAIIWGTMLAAAIYLVFAFFVVAATGGETTPEAIRGLAQKFGPTYLLVGGIIGFLTTITSFIPLGLTLKGMLVADFNLKPEPAWLVAALIPGILYLLGFHNFIAIVGLVGAIAIGIDSVFILLLHREVSGSNRMPSFRILVPSSLRFVLIAMFVAGVIHEFYAFFR